MSASLRKLPAGTVQAFLSGLPLFEGVSPNVLAAVEQASVTRTVLKGACLFLRGDPADTFYLLRSGEFCLTLMSLDGRELAINVIHVGEFFGELGLLAREPRSADAIARQNSEVIGIPRLAFLDLIKAEPLLALRMLELVAKRSNRTSEFESALTFMDAQARLARVVLELDRQSEKRGTITISQEELARRSGLIRQTVAKILSHWRESGWLQTGRGSIVLLNRQAFARILKNHNR